MHTTVLRARWVLPITRPPLENGMVVIAGGRIQEVDRWQPAQIPIASQVVDLGEVILLPGLINAHGHLDYTDLADLADRLPPSASFTDWIRGIVAAKKTWSDAEFKVSWRHGAAMLLRHGTTTIANIETQPEQVTDLAEATPLRIYSFLELIGFQTGSPPESLLQSALNWLGRTRLPRGTAGWAPHAPYTTTPVLLRHLAETARKMALRLTMHIAESQDEFDLFVHRRGPLFDWLKDRRDMSDCGIHSPIVHLEQCGLLSDRLLAVHANYLGEGDARRLGRQRVSVAHCPRSRAFFGHAAFPLEELVTAEVNVCLGTDSLASVTRQPSSGLELDLFAEMRALASMCPGLSPQAILEMATVNGARALGLEGLAGVISPPAWADFAVIPYHGPADRVNEAAINHVGPVRGTMIGGEWIVNPAKPIQPE